MKRHSFRYILMLAEALLIAALILIGIGWGIWQVIVGGGV